MGIHSITALLLTISCYLGTSEGRKHEREIVIKSGGPWGEWGKPEFCPTGFAMGFSLKLHKESTRRDNTGLNGIRLRCTDGTLITSSIGAFGTWSDYVNCSSNAMISFSLSVIDPVRIPHGDNYGALNIKFTCSDYATVVGINAINGGYWSRWSNRCDQFYRYSYICGLQTKVQPEVRYFGGDNTSLTDVKFFCCERD